MSHHPSVVKRTAAAMGRFGVVACLVLLAAVPGRTHALERETPPASIFKALSPGQKISIKDNAGWIEINLLDDGAVGGHVIIELGRTYLLVEDLVGVSRLWIPVTAIRAVVSTRISKRP